MMRRLEIQPVPYVLVILLVTFWAEHSVDFRRHRHVFRLIWRVHVRGQTQVLNVKSSSKPRRWGGVSTASIIVIRHIVPNVPGVVVVSASLPVPSMHLCLSLPQFRAWGRRNVKQLQRWSDGANSMEVSPWLPLLGWLSRGDVILF